MQARIAELEKQVEDQNSKLGALKKTSKEQKGKRKRVVKTESDYDYELSDFPAARGKTIKSEYAVDSNDSSNDVEADAMELRKRGPCRIKEDGADCGRRINHDQMCLTYEDLSAMFKKMEAACVMCQPSLEKWPLLRKWLETQTAQKVTLVEAHVSDRTQDAQHAHSGVKPCNFHTCNVKKRPMLRGWVSIFCDEAVVRHRNVAHVNLLRFRHLLQAFEDNDAVQIHAIVNGLGEILHLCKPIDGKYCWEWTHTAFESSDKNAIRDHYCFTARRLCVYDPLRLFNGEGGRFVPNVQPKPVQHNGWKPAPGRNGRTKYDTVELGAFKSDGVIEIVRELASVSREIIELG